MVAVTGALWRRTADGIEISPELAARGRPFWLRVHTAARASGDEAIAEVAFALLQAPSSSPCGTGACVDDDGAASSSIVKPLAEVAAELGIGTRAARKRAQLGRIPGAYLVAGRWVVRVAS